MEAYDKRGLLDPRSAAAVGDLRLRARLLVEGLLAGLHPSPLRGAAQEFAEYRPYRPGDDPRRVDWRSWGKTDRLYVKTYLEEADLRVWLLIDTSESMNYAGERSGGMTKLDYARTLAAALAYLVVRQGDHLALGTFSSGLGELLPPRRGPLQLGKALSLLEAAGPGGRTDFAALLRQAAPRARRRGLFVLISDLWESGDGLDRALAGLASRRHEALVLHLLDDDEVEPRLRGPLLLEDAEEGGTLTVDGESLSRSFGRLAEEYYRTLERRLRSRRADYLRLTTSGSFRLPLRRFLIRRLRLISAVSGRRTR
ncbi:MAG: DUF58 domain-containing protein [Candidatus Coatesbacteria bacterium]|nr:DUF58 domain-containing protein [Candidatus Coatesbacteria bacterium]